MTFHCQVHTPDHTHHELAHLYAFVYAISSLWIVLLSDLDAFEMSFPL